MTTILLIALAVYMLIGLMLWYIAIWRIGGKREYLNLIHERYNHSNIKYYLGLCVALILWPWLLAIGLKKEDTQDNDESIEEKKD